MRPWLNTGSGVPGDKLHLLFSPFSQADSSTTRQYGGTGLGLAISHRIVTGLGGEIQVESDVGKGTTFWFNLPMSPSDRPAGVNEAPAGPQYAKTGLECLRQAQGFDGNVDATTARELEDLGHRIRLPEIDHVIGAKEFRGRRLAHRVQPRSVAGNAR